MKKIILTAALFGTFLTASVAHAATTYNGVVQTPGTGWGGEGIYFYVQGVASNGCGGNRFHVQSSFASYKEVVAMILAGYSQGVSMAVTVGGNCSGTNAIVIGVGLP